MIESESRSLLADALKSASELIATHRDALDRLVDVLIQRETLEREELRELLDADKVKGEMK